MINSIALTGRLTKDIELRYTQSGIAVAQFTLAVDRQFTNAQGKRDTDFISCVIWRKSAENFVKFTRKGSLVGVEGHVQTRSYDNNQGQHVFVTEVVVENFALLESKQTTQQRPSAPQNQPQNGFSQQPAQSNQGYQQPAQNAAQPQFGTQQSQQNTQNPFAGQSNFDISDDDVPF